MSIEQKARTLYDACPTVKPTWDQLGSVTKSVWIEYAINNREGLHFMNKFNIVQFHAACGVPITADFIVKTLGVKPDETVKRAVFWEAGKYEVIIAALVKHLGLARKVDPCSLNGTRPKKDEAAVADKSKTQPPAAEDDPFGESTAAAEDDPFGESTAAAEDDPFGESEESFF